MSKKKTPEGAVGRPRKYASPAALRKAVERYFASISRTVTVRDENGFPALNDAGDQVMRQEYVVPPSMSALMLHLGISKKTWCNYARSENEEYVWVCDRAKARIEAYLEEQLLTRKKGIQGVIFNLSSNFAWKEKREVEVGSETRKALAATAGMTMEEKLELIKAAALEAAADEDPAGRGVEEGFSGDEDGTSEA